MTDAAAKPNLVKARRPRGLFDRDKTEIAAIDRMFAAIRSVYELYGFEPVETPFVEYTEALGKFLPDLDRPNEGVFSLRDDDEQWLSLRYDLTAPLARYVAENFDALPKPYRSYRCGPVFRNEKPGPGRLRQFLQFDADTVGSASIAADAEIAMMAADCMEKLGIPTGDYIVKVNSRKILDGMMEAIGLGGPDNAVRRLIVLRAIDKLDRLGIEGVSALLGPGRKDESGDFTKGAGLDPSQASVVLSILSGGEATFETIARTLPESQTGSEGIAELVALERIVRTAGYGERRIRIDLSIVRGLEYYTGVVLEAELTFQVPNEQGQPVVFGSVGGGGRYDGLVGRFRGENVPACGFSVGVSRLFLALKAIKSPVVADAQHRGPVVILVLDKDQIAHYQSFAVKLRAENIAAELYLGAAGMNAQLKYADKRRSLCAIIQGSNERDHADGPQVMIRDLVLGAELASTSKNRADYLDLRQKAQFAVPESRLVEAVREVLSRHAG